jgi:hypothetical protein
MIQGAVAALNWRLGCYTRNGTNHLIFHLRQHLVVGSILFECIYGNGSQKCRTVTLKGKWIYGIHRISLELHTHIQLHILKELC